jgi:hypothetical protein
MRVYSGEKSSSPKFAAFYLFFVDMIICSEGKITLRSCPFSIKLQSQFFGEGCLLTAGALANDYP